MKIFSNIWQTVSKFFARFYNALPSQLKIALMVLSSFLAAGFTNLLIQDLTEYNNGITNEYLKLLITGIIPFLTVVYNLLQQWAVQAGTKELVKEQDTKTIERLEVKVEDTKQLLGK